MDSVGVAAVMGACWLASHYQLPLLLETLLAVICPDSYYGSNGVASKIANLTGPRLSNFRKLLRSLAYCIVATICGLYLFVNLFLKWPNDLLFGWSWDANVIFMMSLSHWSITILEDSWAIGHLSMRQEPGVADEKREKYVESGLFVHHIVTIFTYSWSTYSHNLAGLCGFGLLFELPVICLTFREILISFDDIFGLVKHIQMPQFRMFWTITYCLWHLTRTMPTLVYLWSLMYWREELQALAGLSWWLYHTLALVFTYFNYEILFHVIAPYVKSDSKRFLGLVMITTRNSKGEVEYTWRPEGETNPLPQNDQDPDLESNLSLTCSSSLVPKGSGCPFSQKTGTANGLSLLSLQQVAEHASEQDCWLAVRGRVYDVTKLLGKHPGGRDILLQHAGKDATESFLTAGHSPRTVQSMEQYRVADLLNHGYSQHSLSAEQTETVIKEQDLAAQYGDKSKPMELFKSYCRPGDPIFTYAVAGWAALVILGQLATEVGHRQQLCAGSGLLCIAWLSFTMSARYLGLGALSLWLFSVPCIQQLLLTPEVRRWVPVSWTGPTNTLLRRPPNVLGVVLHWRVLLCALALLCSVSTDLSLIALSMTQRATGSATDLQHQPGRFFYLRVAYITTSAAELIFGSSGLLSGRALEYLECVCGLIGLQGSNRRAVMWSDCDVFSCIRVSLKSFESVKFRTVLFIGAAATLDCISSLDVNTADSTLVLLGIGLSSASRLVFTHSLHDCGELFHGDINGAVTVITTLACLMALCGCYWTGSLELALNWSTAPAAATSASLLSPSSASSVMIVYLYFLCWTLPVAFLQSLILGFFFATYAAFVVWSRASFVCHVHGLGGAAALWWRSPALLSGRWWVLVLCMSGLREMSSDLTSRLDVFKYNQQYSQPQQQQQQQPPDNQDNHDEFNDMNNINNNNNHSTAGSNAHKRAPRHHATDTQPQDSHSSSSKELAESQTSVSAAEAEAVTVTVPGYLYTIKDIENLFRHYLSLALYIVIIKNLVAFASAITPQGQRFWCPPSVVVDLGEDCEYGIAYSVNAHPQCEPSVFQCNVGYMGYDGPDLPETASATKNMLRELCADKDAGKKGFVSDLVAIFQLPPNAANYGHYRVREVNLSAWRDEESAYNWYKNSPAHKDIVKKYYNAGLGDFSALLAKLKPAPEQPLRWEVRCRKCRRVVSGPQVQHCPYCQSDMHCMPYF